ncbi:hypothetical protein WA016_02829 [Myxococcus stipitatus]
MRKIWTLGAAGVALSAVLAGGGCYDFDAAQKRCEAEGRCEQALPEDAGCTPSSSSEDFPDDEFADTDCDGVDGRASAGLFVDPLNGDDSAGTGTREKPLRSLSEALTRLRQWDGGSAPTRLYLASGTYSEGHVELDVPVSLHGGYAGGAGGWKRAGNQLAYVDSGTTGITVRVPTDSGVVLEYLHIRSADAVERGQPSIAMRVIDSPNVRLRHTILEAGRGGTGKDGDTGSPGIQGEDGQKGQQIAATIPGDGGAGGSALCPLGYSGGYGADGVPRNHGLDGKAGLPAASSGGTVFGGAGGRGGDAGVLPCDGGGCSCAGFPGGPGEEGGQGIAGDSGAPGSGRGALSSSTWVTVPEMQGGQGTPGTAGGGGGGGGSGGSCIAESNFELSAGGAGGGGGAGGCSGQGGMGGGGGGASIGLLVFSSRVTLEADSHVQTLGGGTGGPGGMGGAGGSGGNGGTGATTNVVSRSFPGDPTNSYQSHGGAGGKGGLGGQGGQGGPGGGGAGGPSVGIWCAPGSQVTLDGGTTIDAGPGGSGGASTGQSGAAGMSATEIPCPPIP